MSLDNDEDFVSSDSFSQKIEFDGKNKGSNLEKVRRITKERSMSNLALKDQGAPDGHRSRLPSADLADEGAVTVDEDGLFENIPEPYPHSCDFQRVSISDVPEEPDRDVVEAAKMAQKCMNLRQKYLSDHPRPPQDIPEIKICTSLSPPASPRVPRKSMWAGSAPNAPYSTDAVKERQYRRREEPIYDPFGDLEDTPPLPENVTDKMEFRFINGVLVIRNRKPPATATSTDTVSVSGDAQKSELPPTEPDDAEWRRDSLFPVIGFNEFIDDFYTVKHAIHAGPLGSYSHRRLEILTAKFNLHELLNGNREADAQKSVPHRDFYNVRKVDTHVHHSACMNQKHLLRFIKFKLKHHAHEAVVFRDGKFLTLEEVFRSLNLSAYELSIDTLDMHANSNTFHRFDRFNLKYNPAGQSRLREIFLKTENVIGGKYLAEITKEVINDLEASKYQFVEWRISIYGRKSSEWASLARWFYVNRLGHMNVRWLIQVPRLYDLYKRSGEIESFGQMLENIFAPLVAVSLDPQSNVPLHYFLSTIVGFDSVDDESKPDRDHLSNHKRNPTPTPENWTSPHSPPFAYWIYYMNANICALNKLRASRGLSTFQFRPHVGEAGDAIDHMVSTYLCAHQINHGILLRKNAALHYLYYLSQVGMALSPLSNNMLFLEYNKNPFPMYFKQGLNVSLSTDDPLMLHYTKDPLVEEYSVATQVWKLTSADQCEIARHSVLQSGWEDRFKLHFLGKDYCDIRETNVPEIRLAYRRECLDTEQLELKKLNRPS